MDLDGEDILSFDLVGKFAHFSKFYTNSSALTYDFPPRTVIIGLLAGILGKDRDSYYNLFSPEKTRISIILKTVNRKIMQTLNDIHTGENFSWKCLLTGNRDPSQTPTQMLISDNDMVKYQVIFYHKAMDNLYERLSDKGYNFPPFLGSAQFLGSIENVGINPIHKGDSESVTIHSVCPLLSVNPVLERNIKLARDRMPFHFKFKDGRRFPINKSFIYRTDCKGMKCKLKCDYYSVDGKNIVFMEE